MLSIVVFLIIVGVLLVYIPMEPRIKTMIVVIVCVVAALWLLAILGFLPLNDPGVPRVR